MYVSLYNILFRSHWADDVILQVVAISDTDVAYYCMTDLLEITEKVESKTYESIFDATEDFTEILRHKRKDMTFHTFLLNEDACDVYVEWAQGDREEAE